MAQWEQKIKKIKYALDEARTSSIEVVVDELRPFQSKWATSIKDTEE